jgi:hypothetical protein
MTLQSLDKWLHNVEFKHYFLYSSQPMKKNTYNLNIAAIIIVTTCWSFHHTFRKTLKKNCKNCFTDVQIVEVCKREGKLPASYFYKHFPSHVSDHVKIAWHFSITYIIKIVVQLCACDLLHKAILEVARSKVLACRRSFTGIAGSKPAEGMDVSLWWVLSVVRERSSRWADYSSRRVLPIVMCLIEGARGTSQKPWPTRGCRTLKKLLHKTSMSSTSAKHRQKQNGWEINTHACGLSVFVTGLLWKLGSPNIWLVSLLT